MTWASASAARKDAPYVASLMVAPVAYHICSVVILAPHGLAFLIYLIAFTAIVVMLSDHLGSTLLRAAGFLGMALPLDASRTSLGGDALGSVLSDCQARVLFAQMKYRRKIPEMLKQNKSIQTVIADAHISTGRDTEAGYTLASGRPVIIEDLASETRFSGAALLYDHGAVSGLATLGGILFFWRRKRSGGSEGGGGGGAAA